MKTKAALLLTLGMVAVALADPPAAVFHTAPPVLRQSGKSLPVATTQYPSTVAIRRVAPPAPSAPAQGLYAAVPFSAIVAVPAETDPKFVVPPGDQRAVGRVIQPPTTLVPLRR
jgi:hypothetical protein